MTKSICSIYLTLAFVSFTALAADSPDFTLHEWGTFTSVSGSDGGLLPGLQAEEEPLPMFVHSHEGMEQYANKGWVRPLANVTIKNAKRR